jgi:hypothetical protein
MILAAVAPATIPYSSSGSGAASDGSYNIMQLQQAATNYHIQAALDKA